MRISIEFISYFFLYCTLYFSKMMSIGNYMFAAAVVILCAINVFYNNGKFCFSFTSFHWYMLIWGVFIFASSFWAVDRNLTIPKFVNWLFTFVAMFFLISCSLDEDCIDDLLKSIMYGGYVVVFYVIIAYGIDGIQTIFAESSRIDNEVINANSLGMAAAKSILINIYYIYKRKLRVTDLFSIPALFMIAASGSRKSIILITFGIVMFYFFSNIDPKRIAESGFKILGIIILSVVVFFFLSRLPIFNNAYQRMLELIDAYINPETITRKNSAWLRFQYNKLGIDLFKENPILGIGIGNANIFTMQYYGHDHYLHNNYIELLACGGIVGFIIFYYLQIRLLFKYYRCFDSHNSEYLICLVLLILHLILDFGCVTYMNRMTFFEIYLLWLEIRKIRSAEECE